MPRNIFGDPYNRLADLESKIQDLQLVNTSNDLITNINLQYLNLSNYQLAVNNNCFSIDKSTFFINANKNIGIGTINPDEKLTVNGNLHIINSLIVDQTITAPNLNQLSDIKLKSNIKPLTDCLNKLEQLRGVEYTFYDKQNIGLIAQEVEKIVPEVVTKCNDCKSISYGNLIALLIEAIKELSDKVKKLESKNL
jgi:hypothetical protein